MVVVVVVLLLMVVLMPSDADPIAGACVVAGPNTDANALLLKLLLALTLTLNLPVASFLLRDLLVLFPDSSKRSSWCPTRCPIAFKTSC